MGSEPAVAAAIPGAAALAAQQNVASMAAEAAVADHAVADPAVADPAVLELSAGLVAQGPRKESLLGKVGTIASTAAD